jgi:hypothetical protein
VTDQSWQVETHLTDPWPVPSPGLPLPLFLLALLAGALLWIGLIVAGQELLCRVDPHSHSYCDTPTSEETR